MSAELGFSQLEKLKCVKCNRLLSVPPVTFASFGGYLCGRCYENGTTNDIYEILAEHFLFPCR